MKFRQIKLVNFDIFFIDVFFPGKWLVGSHHWFRSLLDTELATHRYLNQWWPQFSDSSDELIRWPLVDVSVILKVYSPNPCYGLRSSWWRHQMETFSALLAICAGNSPVTGKFPAQRPVTRSFDIFFDLPLNKRLSKQSWSWWFETLSRPLWRHCIDGHFLWKCSQVYARKHLLTIMNIGSSDGLVPSGNNYH